MTLFTDKDFHAIDEIVTAINANVTHVLTAFVFGLHDGDFNFFGRNDAIHAELCNGGSGYAGRQKGH